MTKIRISKKVMAVIMAILVISGILGIMPGNIYAATPAYVNWRQTDSRWGNIKLGSSSDTTVAKIGCVATSMCCLWVESGACSEDESVFNPKIGITAMKNAGAFSSGGSITWATAAKANGSSFKHAGQVTLSGTQAKKLATIKEYYDKGYYIHVKVVCGSQHWVAVRRFVGDECEIMDTGGTNQAYLSGYTIDSRMQIYTGPKPAGWRYKPETYPKATVDPGTYFLKNSSTNTYINSSSASNGGAVSLAAKKTTNAFKMNITGGKDSGYYITPSISSNYVLNPYSDTPGDGTKITLYEKNSDGTQKWYFEKNGSGYIIHNAYNENCVLTASGTGVLLKTKTGAANQIWTLETQDNCSEITTGDYFLKNSSTGTYMQAAAASNKANVTLAAKKDTNAFKFNVNGSKSAGYYISTKLGTNYVVNPYSDTPANGTVINIYAKDSSGTQLWEFDKVGSGYVIHYKNNYNLCLTVNGTGVALKTRTDAANQIWLLEKPTINYTITFDANGGVCSTGNKTVVSGETYGTLPVPTRSGYNFTGWFTAATNGTQITDTTKVSITSNQTLYAHWEKVYISGDINHDGIITISDISLLQKYLVHNGLLTNEQFEMADLNSDGAINIFDLIILKRYLIG